MKEIVDYLSLQIGARPVGTDEEQKASQYIKEVFDKDTDFDCEIEEFETCVSPRMIQGIEGLLVFLFAIITLFVPGFVLSGFVLSLAIGVLFFLDSFNIFSIGNFLNKGPSQNVVAKRIPAKSGNSKRAKKVVLITNYDTEKIRPEINSNMFKFAGILKIASYAGICLVILSLLFSFMAGQNAFLNILCIIGAILSTLPFLGFILQTTSQYNQGAINNASSVAVMTEVAKRLTTGIYAPNGETPIIHGSEVAKEQNVIPEGATVTWEVAPNSQDKDVHKENIEEDNRQGSGQNIDQNTDQISNNQSAPADEKFESYLPSQQNNETQPKEEQLIGEKVVDCAPEQRSAYDTITSSAPDWFTKGKQRAGKRPNAVHEQGISGVKRSRFGDALEAANDTNYNPSSFDNKGNEISEENLSALEKQLQQIHAQIEQAGQNAVKKSKDDARVAEEVIDNERQQAKQASLQINKESDTKDKTFSSQDTKDNFEERFEVTEREKISYPEISEGEKEVENKKVIDEKGKRGVSGYLKTETESIHYPDVKEEVADKEEVTAVIPSLASEDSVHKEAKQVSQDSKNNDVKVQKEHQKRDILLPSLTGAIEAQKNAASKGVKKKQEKVSTKEKINHLGAQLPSLTGIAPSVFDNHEEENKAQSKVSAGNFAVGENTGMFAPIGDELIEGKSDDEIYVTDVDDQIYQEATTESGAVAGPGYVDIPETRTESMFGKIFHRKNKMEKDPSFSDSIGVDENFDARSVGKARGDWSSFNEDDEWEGGAFSDVESLLSDNRDDIYKFATNDVDVEVWCVALGAEYAGNGGIKNFIDVHKDELKGAIFVHLDALGAGELSLVEMNGVLRRHQMSARLKRIARNAAKNIGINLPSEQNTWIETTTSVLNDNGINCIHVCGVDEQGKPCYLSSKDDIAEVVDENSLRTASDLVMEIVRGA